MFTGKFARVACLTEFLSKFYSSQESVILFIHPSGLTSLQTTENTILSMAE